MCGLVGMVDTRGRRAIDAALLRRMNEAQVHRGPDGAGLHVGEGIGLGHRRLAVIDPAGGHQPLYNEDGSVAAVFDGEIYNFVWLIPLLEKAGHVFRSRCAAEVVIHAWEEWGPDCVAVFDGMFAFALWDEQDEILLLARDRLGKKPLHYASLGNGMLAFGSEIKSLSVLPDLPRDLDPLAVEDYFAFGYVPDPRTIYKAVRKLPPAHRLVWRRGGAPRLDRYWRMPAPETTLWNLDVAAEELAMRLRRATRARLVADVPVGALLSGGVDSCAVVGMMADLSSEPVSTFAIAFAGRSSDEAAYAWAVAKRWGTDHHCHEEVLDDAGPIDIGHVAAMHDEPFGDASALAAYRMCKLARRRFTVALSGAGGDELFGGYRFGALHAAADWVRRGFPARLQPPVFGALGRFWPPLCFQAKALLQGSAGGADGYFAAASVVGTPLRRHLFSPALQRELQGYHAVETVRAAFASADSDDPLAQAQAADLATWLPGGVLVRLDRASMANSLEIRAPLLDHTLAEWSVGLAPELKLYGGVGRRILKRAVQPLMDRDMVCRPRRGGFAMPPRRWLRGGLAGRVRDLGQGPWLRESGMFDMEVVNRLVTRHLSGAADHSAALWLLLMFDSFLRVRAGALSLPAPSADVPSPAEV
ncbi:MAG: asparagine synthase (glutamine-hydrolyzing) [Magnetospirillum sp.]|nr:asparagine synthase (glutamine-hydrolyzing) [Magnetospirillum sp.]